MYKTYLHEKQRIQQETSSYSVRSDAAAYQKFALFTTNLGLALPNIPLRQHIGLFHKAIANRQLSFLDEAYHNSVSWHWEGETLDFEALKSQPAVIGTFHVGSYRFVNHLLVRSGVPIALLVSARVKERQGAAFLMQSQSLGYGDGCELITAEHPMAALQILRAIKSGRTVVGYLDGNRGATGTHHLHTLPFLGIDIRVRIGLAHIAQRAGVPFHGLLTKRCPDGSLALWNSHSFFFDSVDNQCISSILATDLLYADLAAIVREEPWQWDHWYYLHEYFL